MMSNNFTEPRSVKNVWRNVAVAVFAAVFALIGLGVTLFPSRADTNTLEYTLSGTAEEMLAAWNAAADAVSALSADTLKNTAVTINLANDWVMDTVPNRFNTSSSAVLSILFNLNGYIVDLSNVDFTAVDYIFNFGYVSNVTVQNAINNPETSESIAATTGGIISTAEVPYENVTAGLFGQGYPGGPSFITLKNITVTNLVCLSLSDRSCGGGPSISLTLADNTRIIDGQMRFLGDSVRVKGGEIAGNTFHDGIAKLGGILQCYSGTITKNTFVDSLFYCTNGGGLIFSMYGGEITNNVCNGDYVIKYKGNTGYRFIMQGGVIKGNTSQVAQFYASGTVPVTITGDDTYFIAPYGTKEIFAADSVHVFQDYDADYYATHVFIESKETPTDLAVTYNGTDQQIEKMTDKPEWYNAAMSFSYTQNGAEVTEVKDVGEYTVTVQWGDQQRTVMLTVNPREITTEGAVTADNRVYDRTQNVTLNTAAVKLKNVVAGDDVKLVIDGAFADKNVGNDKPVTVTMSLTGADAKNYVLTESQFTTQANIAAKTVTVEGITVEDKEYDNTPRAILNTRNVRFTGLIAGDDLTVAVNGEYGQSTVGDNLTVTLHDLILDGNDANNYVIASESQKEVTGCRIKPRVITVTISDQTVKVDTPQPTLTAKITSGSLASGDTADKVYTLSIVTDAEIDPDHLPVGEYAIKGTVATDPVAQNYDITFVDGKYTVLTAEAWDALQTKKDSTDNNFWLILIIVLAVAAFVGALVGIGLVVRSHDKNRDNKPQKDKKNKDKKATPTDAGVATDNQDHANQTADKK